MAKLGAYYGLCPLIDQKHLLGVSEDKERGHVIVTLGKNIGIRYRLSDQKQIHSWRTKDKFTSPILYDKTNESYIAVFNQMYIRRWNEDEEHIDKLKKFKFKMPIYTILSCNNKQFIVFKNGIVAELNPSIERRKQLEINGIFDEQTEIESVMSISIQNVIYIGLIVNSTERIFSWTAFGDEGLKNSGKTSLKRDNCILIGQTLTQLNHLDNPHLLTFWSDGRMYSTVLDDRMELNLFGLVDSISSTHSVTMIGLNENYIAMYGAKANEDGAILLLYNTQFRITQSRQPLKFFSNEIPMWKLDNRLFLPIGQHLGVVPFHLVTEQLSALIGSHCNNQDTDVTIIDQVEYGSWPVEETKEESWCAPPPKKLQRKIRQRIDDLLQQGLSESMICNEIIPGILEDNDMTSLSIILDYFQDIPEVHTINMLKYCLMAPSKHFNMQTDVKFDQVPKQLEPPARCHLIEMIISKPYTDNLLLPYLRSIFDLDALLLLISYLIYAFSQKTLVSVDDQMRWIDWSCLILDAGYRKLLATRDEQVLETLKQLSEIVKRKTAQLKHFQLLEPLIKQVLRRKNTKKIPSLLNYRYSVEKIKLY